jgi:Mitotic-spindle organizing gamma-tubulin ring associated
VLHDISQLLNTQLDRETLATCVSMIESGVNPEALAVRLHALACIHPATDRYVDRDKGAKERKRESQCDTFTRVVSLDRLGIATAQE